MRYLGIEDKEVNGILMNEIWLTWLGEPKNIPDSFYLPVFLKKEKLQEWPVEDLKKVQEKGEKDINVLNRKLTKYKKNQKAIQDVIKEKEEN